MRSTLPRAFRVAPDGSTTVNTDYFTSVELTSTDPQVVTYTINPKAVWSDGTPITWEDIASQIHATSGKDKAFAIASSTARPGRLGHPRRRRPAGGHDVRQALRRWKGMFAGNTMLLPQEHDRQPRSVQQGSAQRARPIGGTVHRLDLDRTAQRITLTRNPKWWGTPPLLDSITYLVLDDAARIPALQNNTIDATGLGSLDELTIARDDARDLDPARAGEAAGTTSPSTARPDRSSRTRRCGWRSPRASTGKPSPTSPSAAWPTTRPR